MGLDRFEQRDREVVAYACSDRSKETCQILWDRIPSTYQPLWTVKVHSLGSNWKSPFRLKSTENLGLKSVSKGLKFGAHSTGKSSSLCP